MFHQSYKFDVSFGLPFCIPKIAKLCEIQFNRLKLSLEAMFSISHQTIAVFKVALVLTFGRLYPSPTQIANLAANLRENFSLNVIKEQNERIDRNGTNHRAVRVNVIMLAKMVLLDPPSLSGALQSDLRDHDPRFICLWDILI